ncbi:class I SAM-dependent methyltransferase [Waterburya agarophytonicola K14]|uniref:Class I SAM-dependent methyltransferase n=1 Tax=Waterburya agarophytonicola KI4 TaxID=2874699 RepID=A0A964BPH6_9CYAN|nr:class I SAM-dependent methyltransferase [Waterburya agarophytonicola]MCC0176421.1 class I SAM-dependent methyltransferase [Waterburya agarophytonicola KI4]
MTVTTSQTKIGIASRLVNGVLAIAPLANFAKNRARNMMIKRAESIGVPWRENVRQLSDRDWSEDLTAVENPDLEYPAYYTTSFHAYDEGNLSWKAAWEVESASRAVHAQIWSSGDVSGDPMLRQSYSQAILENIAIAPHNILDLGCGAGMSTFELQNIYPQAQVTGVDLSPYFLAVAKYRGQQNNQNVRWVHAAAETTGLPDASFDFVSACLMFHELPTDAAEAIIKEAHRLLRPGGYLGIMDMNPQSEIFLKMPPYILTLLKSTEPYLDQYFALDMEQVFTKERFTTPSITINSPRHRAIIAQKL